MSKNLSLPDWGIVGTVLRQLAIPLVVAAAYGLLDYSQSEGDFQATSFIKVCLPALFFIMWFVGLYEREKKRSTDQSSFDGVTGKLETLTELVRGLGASPHALTKSTHTTTPGTSYSAQLMEEAFVVASTGHRLAALLQAGIAFEHAVRSLAHRAGVLSAASMPLFELLRSVEVLLPPGWRGEVHTLRKIRNAVAHASGQELERIGPPDQVLNSYSSAIHALNEVRGTR